VALARALVYGPPVLLLDEPFSALDKNLRGQMQDEVRRLHRETGTTFVFVTHDQSEALALSTRIAVFEKGRLQQIGAPRAVYERPENRFVAEFLGDINILPLAEAGDDGGRFERQALRAGAGGKPGAHNLAIRAEYMRLHLSRPAAGNAVAARLGQMTYLGAETRLALRTPGEMAVPRRRASVRRKPFRPVPSGPSRITGRSRGRSRRRRSCRRSGPRWPPGLWGDCCGAPPSRSARAAASSTGVKAPSGRSGGVMPGSWLLASTRPVIAGCTARRPY
jgi:ABC-type sugar transport system ATPase subunit